jgi:DNA-binding transcriptional LysR family regulator
LTAAAVSLDTSLPSVVRTLAALERHLGVRLLNRTTRRLHLTDEGTQYLERCRLVLAAVQDADASVIDRQAEPQGRLSITASVLFGRFHVAPIVRAFLARYPAVSAELLFVDRVVNVVEEGIDVAVRIGHLPDSSLIAIPVGQVRRVVCASERYLRRFGIPRLPQDLRLHRCVRHTGLSPRNEWSFRVGRRDKAVPINTVMTTNQIDTALAACADGLGLGMFLSYQTQPLLSQRKLRYVLEGFETPPVPLQVVYPHSRLLSATVRTFLDHSVPALQRLDLG